jgi:predicted  nucleic acid-binding Zn-ribbon protein
MAEVEKDVSELKTDVRKILVIVDGIAKKMDDFQTEKAAGEQTFRRNEHRIDDHEVRIQTLETKRAS